MSYVSTLGIAPSQGLAAQAFRPGGWPAAFPHAPWSLQAAGPRVLAGHRMPVGANLPPAGRRYIGSFPSMHNPGLRGLGDVFTDLLGGTVDQAVNRVIDLSWARLEPRFTEKVMPMVAMTAVAAIGATVAASYAVMSYYGAGARRNGARRNGARRNGARRNGSSKR